MSALTKDSLAQRIWVKKAYYLYLLPTFALLITFSYYPALNAIFSSFFEWSAQGDRYFVGLENFRDMLTDTVLIASVGNLVKLLVFGLVVGTIVPLIVAEAIFNLSSDRSKFWYRWLLVVPMVVPGMVTLLLWGFIFNPDVGLLNAFLRGIGLAHLQQRWLQDPDIALYCLMFMGFPWVSGVNVLIYLAGLNNIGRDVIDSCLIDGATGIRRVISVDVPMVLGQVKLLIILGIIGGIQGFGTQLILTRGGPGYSTMVPGLHMYQQAFLFDRLGYACAIGVMMFLVILFFTYINMRYLKSSIEYEAK